MVVTPFFSIITATRNAAATLPRLLASLASQSYRDFEVIIQDGASTDNTVAVAEARRERLPALSLVSRPDNGICDAWNKALPRIRGQWVLFLGADDFILNASVLAALARELSALPERVLYAASPVILVNAAACALDTLIPSRVPERDLPKGMPVPHQGLFHRSRLFADSFDPALRIAGDYDFFCRTLSPGNLVWLDRMCVCMGLGGLSGNLHGMLRRNLEVLRVSRRYFPARRRLPLLWRIVCSLAFKGIASLLSDAAGCAAADCYRSLKGKPALWSRRTNPVLNALSLAPVNTTDEMSPTPATGASTAKAGVLFSLLVATLGRIEPLRELLAGLVGQTCRDFEILLADQNPPGFLDGVYAEFRASLPLRVIPVPDRGVSSARNELLPHARGTFIAFPDDDCRYRPDTLEQAAAFFAANPHVHVLLGQWHDPAGTARPRPQRSGRAVTRFSAFRHAGTLVQFYRKAVVDAVGVFDPGLGPGTGLPYGCGEDTDYLLRALAAGCPVVSAPGVQVCHPDISRVPPSPEKIRSYALGRMHLLRKHNFPLWFKLATVAYPLLRIPFEGRQAWAYRKTMFLARMSGLFSAA